VIVNEVKWREEEQFRVFNLCCTDYGIGVLHNWWI